MDVAHQHTETVSGDDVLVLILFGLRLLHGHRGGLRQLLCHKVLQVLRVAEHQVAAGDAPALELLLGDLAIAFHRVQHMEHVLLVLDPARQEGELVEKAIQVDFIVDMVQIGFSFDDIQFILLHSMLLFEFWA